LMGRCRLAGKAQGGIRQARQCGLPGSKVPVCLPRGAGPHPLVCLLVSVPEVGPDAQAGEVQPRLPAHALPCAHVVRSSRSRATPQSMSSAAVRWQAASQAGPVCRTWHSERRAYGRPPEVLAAGGLHGARVRRSIAARPVRCRKALPQQGHHPPCAVVYIARARALLPRRRTAGSAIKEVSSGHRSSQGSCNTDTLHQSVPVPFACTQSWTRIAGSSWPSRDTQGACPGTGDRSWHCAARRQPRRARR